MTLENKTLNIFPSKFLDSLGLNLTCTQKSSMNKEGSHKTASLPGVDQLILVL